jgi:hypothetical protein
MIRATLLLLLGLSSLIASAQPFVVEDYLYGTNYYITLNKVIVDKPVNTSGYNLTLYLTAENFLFGDGQSWSEINATPVFWQGAYSYHLSFDREGGILRFQIPGQGQQFVSPMKENGSIRAVLPEGYTTGDRILGIPRPYPYQVLYNGDNTVVVWNSSPQERLISVSFYKKSAPVAISAIFLVLAVLALALIVEYQLTIRRLRSLRQEREDSWKR